MLYLFYFKLCVSSRVRRLLTKRFMPFQSPYVSNFTGLHVLSHVYAARKPPWYVTPGSLKQSKFIDLPLPYKGYKLSYLVGKTFMKLVTSQSKYSHKRVCVSSFVLGCSSFRGHFLFYIHFQALLFYLRTTGI